MLYRFLGDSGTFVVKDPQRFKLYLPLTDAKGALLSAISPALAGDIKRDNDHFLTVPASIEDLRSNPLCRREFFLKIRGRVVRLSRPGSDRLEAGILYQRLTKKIGALRVEILNFIPADIPAEVMRVTVTNSGTEPVEITPTSFIPLFGRSEKNLRDHRHVSSLLNRVQLHTHGIVLVPSMAFDEKGHTLNQTRYYVLGYEEDTRAPVGQFPTLDCFLGSGDVFSPEAIYKDIPAVQKHYPEFDGKEACAALRFKTRTLPPGAAARFVLVMGIEDSEERIRRVFSRLDTLEKVSCAFEATTRYWQEYARGIEFDFKDKDFNNWLMWVKLQPTLRRLFGCSFLPHFDYGKGGRGWRDLWQDALALTLNDPARARTIITGSFKGVRLDGSNATIVTGDGSFIADRNRLSRVWMDHGVWPFITTQLYLHRTNELSLLFEELPYFRDHQLKRAQSVDKDFKQKDFLQRTTTGAIYRGTILEHLLIQNLVQFFNVGRHNIVRLENADWNDGLDMAAQKGESVAFSFMYCANLKGIAELLRQLEKKHPMLLLLKETVCLMDTLRRPVNYSDFRQKQHLVRRYLESVKTPDGSRVPVATGDVIADLEAKHRHMAAWLAKKEWLAQGFFNGYYDNNARRVEGKKAGRIQMMLASQVFSVMSGVASQPQILRIVRAAKTHLFDKTRGGFRLNTDFGRPCLELGRAFGFSYGDKENGAFFNHMNVMFAHALYRRGFIAEARKVFNSIFGMATSERAGIGPMIPEYFNAQGKGLYLYLTGSASWYVYTLAQEMLGIKFVFGELCLEPKLMSSQLSRRSLEATISLGAKRLRLIYEVKTRVPADRPLRIKKVVFRNKEISCSDRQCRVKVSSLTAAQNTIRIILQ